MPIPERLREREPQKKKMAMSTNDTPPAAYCAREA
jgi:hypothetical protein